MSSCFEFAPLARRVPAPAILQGRIVGAGRREGALPQFRGRKEVPVQARGEVVLRFKTYNATLSDQLSIPSLS